MSCDFGDTLKTEVAQLRRHSAGKFFPAARITRLMTVRLRYQSQASIHIDCRNLAAHTRTSIMSDSSSLTLQQIRDQLYSAVVCDALDSMGLPNQSPRVAMQNLVLNERLVGRCRTTLWADMFHSDPQPYELELQAVDSCQPDDIIIAAAGGSMRSGVWGELLTTAARNGGCVGAIVDGAVRDVARIRDMNFSVIARGTCIYDSKDRQRVIEIDVPVEIGGVVFCPGDLVVADEDGIVVVPQQAETEALQRAWEKVHAENEVRDAIRDGMKAMDAWKTFGVL
jgi:4-hydroxy-4-methyl-2-oxoglutarate aldolase